MIIASFGAQEACPLWVKSGYMQCLAIERERGSVEAIYCGRSLLCRPTYWRGSAGSSDVISAAFNVEFHFECLRPARRQ